MTERSRGKKLTLKENGTVVTKEYEVDVCVCVCPHKSLSQSVSQVREREGEKKNIRKKNVQQERRSGGRVDLAVTGGLLDYWPILLLHPQTGFYLHHSTPPSQIVNRNEVKN